MTTRLIGAIIMVHGDDNGLVLPPMIAPTQVIVIPIAQHKEGVLEKAEELKNRLSGFRVKLDATDNKPGWKFAEAEMRGIPVRVETDQRISKRIRLFLRAVIQVKRLLSAWMNLKQRWMNC